MKKYIMFDLDGTLIDSSKDVTRLLIKVLCDCGYPVAEDTYIKIGPPLNKMIEAAVPSVTQEDNQKIVEYFRKLYKVDGTVMTTPYHGIISLLKRLRADGCKIFIVTYKPRPMCKDLLPKFFEGLYDDLITPTDIDDFENGKSKVDMFKLLLKKWNTTADACVMIGDAKSDVECANAAGITSIGAEYGYAEKDDLKNADYIVSDVKDLYECIKSI